MKKVKKKFFRAKKNTPKRVILKRTIAFFTLLLTTLFIARPVLGGLFENNFVLGDRIYLATGAEYPDSGDEFNKHEEKKRREYEQQKKQEQQRIKEEYENPKVLCVGPDNKKFKTSKKECEKLSELAGIEPDFEVVEVAPTLEPQENAPETYAPETEIWDDNGQSETDDINDYLQSPSSATQPVIEQRTAPLPVTPIEVLVKATGQTIDINSKAIQIELKQEDGKIVAKAKQTDGTELELQDSALFHIEERLAIDKIKIATTSAQEFLIQKNNTAAVTNFPLSWDLTTNTLVVTTPGGRKNVPILPDQAVQNLIAANMLDQAVIPESLRKDRNVHLGTILDIATLTHLDGEPVYNITGITGKKLFGLFPVAIEKTVVVSGTTGKAIDSNKTPINTIIDLISF